MPRPRAAVKEHEGSTDSRGRADCGGGRGEPRRRGLRERPPAHRAARLRLRGAQAGGHARAAAAPGRRDPPHRARPGPPLARPEAFARPPRPPARLPRRRGRGGLQALPAQGGGHDAQVPLRVRAGRGPQGDVRPQRGDLHGVRGHPPAARSRSRGGLGLHRQEDPLLRMPRGPGGDAAVPLEPVGRACAGCSASASAATATRRGSGTS